MTAPWRQIRHFIGSTSRDDRPQFDHVLFLQHRVGGEQFVTPDHENRLPDNPHSIEQLADAVDAVHLDLAARLAEDDLHWNPATRAAPTEKTIPMTTIQMTRRTIR
jgi:hypothetical protein